MKPSVFTDGVPEAWGGQGPGPELPSAEPFGERPHWEQSSENMARTVRLEG